MLILILTYILNVIDYLETLYLVHHFGIGIEANPLARYLFENNLAWLKLIVPAILLRFYGILVKKDKKVIIPIYFVFVVYLYVVIHNFSVIIQAGLI